MGRCRRGRVLGNPRRVFGGTPLRGRHGAAGSGWVLPLQGLTPSDQGPAARPFAPCSIIYLPATFASGQGRGCFAPGGPRSTPRPSLRPSPPAPLHFGPFICCVLLFGGSPRRAGKAAQCRQEEEEGWGEARPELCQMWERREGGTLAARSLPTPPPPPAPAPRRRWGGPAGDPVPGDTTVSPGRGARPGLGEPGRRRVSIPTRVPPRGVGGEPGPPRRSPLSPPSTPRIVPGPAGGRRSRAKGQHAVGARAAEEGRQEGRQEGSAASVPEPPVMLLELLVQAACVSLFLPGGQGRVYPGRKKPASFAVER